MKLQYECGTCKKIFRANVDRRRIGQDRYCSVQCRINARKKDRIKKVCVVCNKDFLLRKGYKRKRNCCSIKCRSVYQKTHPTSGSFVKGQTGKAHPAYKHGKTPAIKLIRKGDANYKWKIAVLKRDNYTCQKCFKEAQVEVHHIKSFTHHPELRFDVNNGTTLCLPCHYAVHKRSYPSEYEQIGRIKLICKICGKEFKVQPIDVKRGRKLCSRKCYAKYRLLQPSSKLKFICKVCGKEFFTFPSHAKIRTNVYCSNKCHFDDMNKIVKCQACGKEFRTHKYLKRKYCSLKCVGIASRQNSRS